MRSTRGAAVVLGVLLVTGSSAACGTDPEEIEIGDGIAPTVEDGDGGAQAPADGDATAGPSATVGVEAGASPTPGSCLEVPTAGDGVYPVADAGIVTVTVTDDALALAAVEPFAGWEYEVAEDEPGRVEVELRKNGAEVDLEVEVEDGEVLAEVCADDD